MDLQKLIEQRDKMVADVTARLEGRGADAGAASASVEIEQARRVEERIASLERSKEEFVARIDAELETLGGELAARRGRIDAENRSQKALAKEVAAAQAPTRGKGAAATGKADDGEQAPAPAGTGIEAAADGADTASSPGAKKKGKKGASPSKPG